MPLKKNEKIMLIVIAAAAVAFAIFDPYYLWRTPPDQAVAANKESKDKESENVAAVDTVWPFSQERITLKEWGRDPFVQARPELDVEALFGDLKLGVISVKGNDRMAMINSKPVRVGDEVNGLKVTSIESGRVILQSGEISYTLTWEK